MNEIQRLQQLAGIITEDETGDSVEKTVVGHVDDESRMIKQQLFQAGQYCVDLYKMMDSIPNGDLPAWIQSKITRATDYISDVKHYLEAELEAPDEDTYVSDNISNDNDPSGV